jgi:hypothetical protein
MNHFKYMNVKTIKIFIIVRSLEVFDCFSLKFKISSFNVALTWTLGFGIMIDFYVTYYVAGLKGNTIYILRL